MHILIVDKVHSSLISELEGNNHQVNYSPDYTYNDTYNCIESYDGVVVRSKFKIDKELIQKGENLKFIARAGVGLDLFDVEYANQKNIKILNAAGANANAVAEHALGMLLSLSSKINVGNNQVKNFQWKREENRGVEIDGKTIGLIGYGNTGQAFARKIKGFNCEILSYDKYKSNFSDNVVEESTLENIYNKADIVSLHIPLDEETKYLCDADFFNSFRKDIVFINTARGKIVKTTDLVNSLKTGKVIGACLDVLEDENFEDLPTDLKSVYHKLFNANVIVTPHVAGWSFQSFENISKVLAENILSITD